MSGPRAFRLEALGAGAFALSEGGRRRVVLDRATDGWRIEAGDGTERGRLARNLDPGGGFVVWDPREAELGRTCRLPGTEPGTGPAVVVLDDGRMFRTVHRGLHEPRIELVGWEAAGAYLVARPSGGGFAIEETPAGALLAAEDPMLILFAAEVLSASEREPDGLDEVA